MWYHLLRKQHQNISLLCSNRVATPPSTIAFENRDKQIEHSTLHVASTKELKDADLVLCCVKSFDVIKALSPIIASKNQKAIILLCHNGLGVIEQMPESWLSQYCFLAMLTTHAAKRINAFHVQHTGTGKCDIGVINRKLTNAQAAALVGMLEHTLPPIHWQDNIKQMQWQKLAINCVINPLTAIHNIDNGEISRPEFQQITQQILKELVAVSAHETDVFLELQRLNRTGTDSGGVNQSKYLLNACGCDS